MKKLGYGAAAVALLALVTLMSGISLIAQQAPDLVVRSIKLKPATPEAGAPTIIRAWIANQGGSDVIDAFDVLIEVDGEMIAQRSITQLAMNRSRTVDVPWTAVAGTHQIRILVDEPFSVVRESTKENNRLSLEVHVIPPATIRSATRQIIESFGEALEQSGKALKFELSTDALKVYSDALAALTSSADALREILEDLQLIKGVLPAALIQQEQFQKADLIASKYDAVAELTLRMMGALSLGNFDGLIEQEGILRANVFALSQERFEGISFGVLAPAVAQLDKIIPLTKEFRVVFGGGQGRDLTVIGQELFEAFLNYGLALAQAGANLKQASAPLSASFMDSAGNPITAYFSGSMLIITAANAHSVKLAILDANGQLLREAQAAADRLEFDGKDSAGNALQPGTYYYTLTIQNTVTVMNELGRLIVSTQQAD
jgi:hypothetical protein